MVDNERIKAEMKYKGLTQQDLANRLGIHVITIGKRLKNGKWQIWEIKKLMEILELPSEVFLGRGK
jgi:transcriptional regulator with XRE-family HTH domain